MTEIKPEYFTQIGASEPMKIETLKFDPERLEIVKQILKQNQMILNFILEPSPSYHIFDGVDIDWINKMTGVSNG